MAMKKLNLKELSREDKKFLNKEVELHRSLDHPNIIKFLG